uniref:Transmembrane protein n=1 Tax=Caenorhabditis japonica TaxID=281687 RepID=A0A8R1IBM5_CAEJA
MVFGQSEQCPEGIVVQELFDENEKEATPDAVSRYTNSKEHSALTVILVAAVASLISLIVGAFFKIGIRINTWAASSEQHRSASSTSGSDYDSFGRARLTRHDSLTTAAKVDHGFVPQSKTKLSDRSGVTSLTTLSPDNVFIGCDSGGVYKLNASETDDVSTMHTHLSTVVGIVVAAGVLHSVSLDCAVVSSSVLDSTNPNVSRRPTIIDMPGAMVKAGGGSNLVVVGDGVQILEV